MVLINPYLKYKTALYVIQSTQLDVLFSYVVYQQQQTQTSWKRLLLTKKLRLRFINCTYCSKSSEICFEWNAFIKFS